MPCWSCSTRRRPTTLALRGREVGTQPLLRAKLSIASHLSWASFPFWIAVAVQPQNCTSIHRRTYVADKDAKLKLLLLSLIMLGMVAPTVHAEQSGFGPEDAERQYDATCENAVDVIAGIHPDAWAWSPVYFPREYITDIGISDPIMLTVICNDMTQVVCMEIFSAAKAKGMPVEMRGRVRSIEAGVIYLDPCHSIPVE